MIAACYRRDEAQNPELFADAVALVLADYPADIVRIAVDPRTGIISGFPMGLPNVGQIKQYLDGLLEKQERLARYAAIPKQPKRNVPDHVDHTSNLFVPEGSPRYEKMIARHNIEPDRGSYFDSRVCADGVKRRGIWVPLDWWEQPTQKREDQKDIGPLRASEYLQALIQRQMGGNDGSSNAA